MQSHSLIQSSDNLVTLFNEQPKITMELKKKSDTHLVGYSIADSINLARIGLVAFSLAEYFEINLSKILGITGKVSPRLFLAKEVLNKISRNNICNIIKDNTNNLLLIPSPIKTLQFFSKQKILSRFPYFHEILNISNYNDANIKIENEELFDRCLTLQKHWQQSSETALPHLISSHQALLRLLASRMKSPLILNFENNLLNGLSVEYQCEIYSNHLYGAKLLEAWHHYLLDPKPKNRPPEKFLDWLNKRDQQELQLFGIFDLKEIPRVCYIENEEERLPWILNFRLENFVENNQLPKPNKINEEIEIIYVLENSNLNFTRFFGGLKKRGVINHSSFFAGRKVSGAGRFLLRACADNKILSWKIVEANNDSGHIKPNNQMVINTLLSLQKIGLNLKSIHWVSKWGTLGLKDETCDIALKRLTRNYIKSEFKKSEIDCDSKKIEILQQCANNGMFQLLDDLITINRYKYTVDEARAICLLIILALEKHLICFGKKTPTHYRAKKLADQAIRLFQDTGKDSEELRSDLENIVTKYQSNDVLFKRTNHQINDKHFSFRAIKSAL